MHGDLGPNERSKEDAKKIRQMGAVASGAARRRKKSLSELKILC